MPPPAASVWQEASGAVGKSMDILSAGSHKAVGVEDGKLIHGGLPFSRCPAPFSRDVLQRQPQEPGRRLVAGEIAPVLDDLSQPHVQQ